jgi:tetratricopeptide (TPR) repeat protein
METRPALADTTDPRAQRLLVRGITQAQLDDYEEAISRFEAALGRSRNAPALLDALAGAYQEQGDLTTALFYARQARQHGAARPYYHRRLAEVQRAAGKPAAALRTYQQLLNQFPERDAAHRALASLQAKLGRVEAATQSYEAYLAQTERPPVFVYRQLLSLYRDAGNADGVEKMLRTLVDRRPNVSTYRRQLGDYYAGADRPEDALALLSPLARRHPDDQALQQRVRELARRTGQTPPSTAGDPPSDTSVVREESTDALLGRARSLHDAATASSPADTAQLQTAEGLLDRVLEQSPEHEAALSLRARLYESRGRFRKAGRVLDRLLERNPRAPERWVQAARAHRRAHLYVHAAEVAEEGLLLFPGHRPLARIAAFSCLHTGAPARAQEHFREALSLLNDSTGADTQAVLRAGLGLAHARLGRRSEADEALARARSLAPNHPDVLRLSAESLTTQTNQTPRLDEALDFAKRATKHAPKSASAHRALGRVYHRRGELEAARRHLRIALDAAPPSAALLERLGDVEQALGNEAAAEAYWTRAAERPAGRSPDHGSPRDKLGDPKNS